MVSYIMGGIQVKAIWKLDPEENIWETNLGLGMNGTLQLLAYTDDANLI